MFRQMILSFLTLILGLGLSCLSADTLVDAGANFGKLPLVDEINCGDPKDSHEFKDSGKSKIETLLGQPCRVIANTDKNRPHWIAWKIGKGKGLKAGEGYLLAIEFPDDQSRTIYISNRGCETTRGLRTGAALGDVLYTYTDNNLESLKMPQTGKMQTWRQFFFLQNRYPGLKQPRGNETSRDMTPDDGFWVIISQPTQLDDPANSGAAVAKIRLFRIPDEKKLAAKITRPPKELPQRHIIWREEMSDGAIGNGAPKEKRGFDNENDFFENKARLMKLLAMDTYCKDLLEFGHNQGWDCGDSDAWYNRSKRPKRWPEMLKTAKEYGFYVLPYYEYGGSIGKDPKVSLGIRKLCKPMSGQDAYTHIKWSEKINADVTDPDTLEDAKKLLDATIVRYKDDGKFLGAWFRTRPSMLPISFSDATRKRFAAQANNGKEVSVQELRADKKLLNKYYAWWNDQRKAFLIALRDYLRENVNPEATIFFTAYSPEPAPSLQYGGKKVIVTDDVMGWQKLLAEPGHKTNRIAVISPNQVKALNMYEKAALSPPGTWGRWEWQHSVPPPDPKNYKDTAGVVMTYPLQNTYTATSPKAFDAFTTPGGLAAVRMYPLNEKEADKALGYFVADVERAGPYSLREEALAMANGDPRYLGYLHGGNMNRGFPEYARAFNAAFLALPALPSKKLIRASNDSEVIVRAIPTKKYGVYLAVINTSLKEKLPVITLPADGKLTEPATGNTLSTVGGRIKLRLWPCQLRTFHIAP